MNNFEAKTWRQDVIANSLVRKHLRDGAMNAPGFEDVGHFISWFTEWREEAERLLDQTRFWDSRYVMEWAVMTRSQPKQEAA